MLAALALLLVLQAVLFLCFGAVVLTPQQLASMAASWLSGASTMHVDSGALAIAGLRLPRLALGIATGAALAVSGAALQAVFRNPLVDPGLIGVSAGAAFAAAATTILGERWLAAPLNATIGLWLLPLAAFVGGLFAVASVYQLGRVRGQVTAATLLLAGVAVTALASAATGLLVYAASDTQVRSLLFWNLGSLGAASPRHVFLAAGIGGVVLLLLREARGLDASLLGDGAARLLGYDVAALRRRILAASALAVGASVAVTGVVGFVGLVVPHLLRPLIGASHRRLLPAAALLGGSMLLAADTVARSVVAPTELPLGVVTALVGAPAFLWLLRHQPQATDEA